MSKRIAIGIDPGKKGFMTFINKEGDDIFYKPLLEDSSSKYIDFSPLRKVFYELNEEFDLSDICHCVIEDVHSIPGSSAQSNFNFGYIVGALEELLKGLEIPFTKVAPKTWQKEMWQGVALKKKFSSTGKTRVNDTKAMSLEAAKRLFPREDFRRNERAKNPDDNKVDSLLIAEYCRRKFL